MPLQRIAELEQLLFVANESVTRLTLANTQLTTELSGTESRNRKLRRNARRDDRRIKEQIQLALSKRPL